MIEIGTYLIFIYKLRTCLMHRPAISTSFREIGRSCTQLSVRMRPVFVHKNIYVRHVGINPSSKRRVPSLLSSTWPLRRVPTFQHGTPHHLFGMSVEFGWQSPYYVRHPQIDIHGQRKLFAFRPPATDAGPQKNPTISSLSTYFGVFFWFFVI